MWINWINNIKDLYFTEYLPAHNIVWRNKNKINWILNQNFYLNWWMEEYELVKDLNWYIKFFWIKKKNKKIITLLFSDISLSYIIPEHWNIFIQSLKNNSDFWGLWVRLINSVKRIKNKSQKIILLDNTKEYNEHNNKNLKDYYKKQWFIEEENKMFSFK